MYDMHKEVFCNVTCYITRNVTCNVYSNITLFSMQKNEGN